MNFQVTIELPKSKNPLTIGSLETDMPIFSHSLETREGAVTYQSLHLKTATARVEAVVGYSPLFSTQPMDADSGATAGRDS